MQVWTFTINVKDQQCLSQNLSVQGLLSGTCTGSGFGVLGMGCLQLANMGKVLERRLCIHGLCLKYSKQAVVSNDSHMIPRWNKTSNFVFTYLDISTGLQVMSTWDCSFSSSFHCLQNLIFTNHGVRLYHSQDRVMCWERAHQQLSFCFCVKGSPSWVVLVQTFGAWSVWAHLLLQITLKLQTQFPPVWTEISFLNPYSDRD